ncbi:MAG: uroporphyrinogen decarboxylase family protein [Clostridiaceae bacterium]|nr:uroporphyrinogen decarboxylase family protein [Clostridiaceae bacterium]
MEQLDTILKYLEDNLDADHLNDSRKRYKQSFSYQGTGDMPLRVTYPDSRFERYSYGETVQDMEKMLVNELITAASACALKDDALPMIRANYGVGILPSLFGVQCRVLENNMPWVDPVKNIDGIRSILHSGVPDIHSGLGKKVFLTHEFYQEVLAKYPVCQKLISIYHPDTQGPFDTAHLIWGSDIYYALYDEPELVHELLELICDTYIRFIKAVKADINDEAEGFVCHWGTLFRGGIVLRNDTSVNLSKELYEEYVRPYDEKLLEAFGGGSIHYCGRADQWVFSMMECKNLFGMNFGQPQNLVFGYDFLDKIYKTAKSKKITITDYGISKENLAQAYSRGFDQGISFSVEAKDRDEAVQILKTFRNSHTVSVPR